MIRLTLHTFGSKKEKKSKYTLFISSFPKSGSTYLFKVLQEITKYERVRLDYHYLREQDLYLPSLRKYAQKNTITKHHTLASPPNIELFRQFSINPLVLVRNIYDVLVSLRDHLLITKAWPTLAVPKDFENLSNIEQLDFLIDNALPWYIYFYVSWSRIRSNDQLPVLFITYKDITENIHSSIDKILEFWELERASEKIKEKVIQKVKLQKKDIRLNRGISGRGHELLTDEQKMRIIKQTGYYSDIDFSLVGITKDAKQKKS